MGSSSPTRDRTQAPCTESMVSDPLDHQGSPLKFSSDDFYFLSEEASSPAGDEDALGFED